MCRLFAALVLTELICGDAESRDVAKRFDLNQGQVEGLQEKAGGRHSLVACSAHGVTTGMRALLYFLEQSRPTDSTMHAMCV